VYVATLLYEVADDSAAAKAFCALASVPSALASCAPSPTAFRSALVRAASALVTACLAVAQLDPELGLEPEGEPDPDPEGPDAWSHAVRRCRLAALSAARACRSAWSSAVAVARAAVRPERAELAACSA